MTLGVLRLSGVVLWMLDVCSPVRLFASRRLAAWPRVMVTLLLWLVFYSLDIILACCHFKHSFIHCDPLSLGTSYTRGPFITGTSQ